MNARPACRLNIKTLLFAICAVLFAACLCVVGIYSTPAKAWSTATPTCYLHLVDGRVQSASVNYSFTFPKLDNSYELSSYTYVSSVTVDGEAVADEANHATRVLDDARFSSADADKWRLTYTGTADTVIHIYYAVITYDLTYNFNDFAANVEHESYIVTHTVGQLLRPTRQGYDFDGWYVDGGDTLYTAGGTLTDDLVLNAKWQLNDPYLAAIQSAGQSVTYGEEVVLSFDYASPEVQYQYSWLKRGDDGTWSIVSDARSLVLKNVADSGVYRLKIGYKDFSALAYNELYSGQTTVNIAKRVLGISPQGADGLLFDGKTKTVGAVLTGLVFGDTPAFSIEGNQATDVGNYTARVYNLSGDNYALPSDTTFGYSIKKGEIAFAGGDALPEIRLCADNGFSIGATVEYSTGEPLSNIDYGNGLRYEGSYGLTLNGAVNGLINVSIKATAAQLGRFDYKVYIADGEEYKQVDAHIDGQYIVFETDTVGDFVLFSGAYFTWWMWLLSLVLALLVIGGAVAASIALTAPKKAVAVVSAVEEPLLTTVAVTSVEESVPQVVQATELVLAATEEAVDKIDVSLAFQSKMANADAEVRRWYSEIKNALLSYQGVKSRVSSGCDSFRRARVLLAKITLIGTTLRVSLALDPAAEKYNTGCFPHKDKGDKPMYKDVPFQVKIKTDLGLRRALALIDDVMSQKKLKHDAAYVRLDYAAMYENIEISASES